VVATVPLERYGEDAINRRLSNLEWVTRAAVAHESVVESFADAACLPMKLFTIFSSDERALADVARQGDRVAALLSRVAHHQEWGVRVVLGRRRALPGQRRSAGSLGRSGADYLTRKKAERDSSVELSTKAREIVAELYDALAERSSSAKRRTAGEMAANGGPLLLDAVFLVSRPRSARFQASVVGLARRLAPQGYLVSLSGPWPPYNFMWD
jgi:hypothetical protein